VHLAVDFIISEMLGCSVEYSENQAPAVLPAKLEALEIDDQSAFRSAAYKRFEVLEEKLRTQYGYLLGDTNWGGILNVALDLRGQDIFLDFYDQPNEVVRFLSQIALVIEKFCQHMLRESGSTSISCNRTVRHIREPVMLHSQCSHTMISVSDYERFLMRYDADWSRKYRPYGIHYCGTDPHRYAQAFASLPHLDFLDVGWGADVSLIRRHLPNTFLNIRLSPVELLLMQEDHIRHTIVKLVHDSNNPWLTGVCCINLDSEITNEKVSTILETVKELRLEYGRHT
jgi:uroporphyrinogen-III decarboxylase